MLKSELIRPRLVRRDDRLSTRPIPVDYHHPGRSRGELAEALREYEGSSLAYPRIRDLAAAKRCAVGPDRS